MVDVDLAVVVVIGVVLKVVADAVAVARVALVVLAPLTVNPYVPMSDCGAVK